MRLVDELRGALAEGTVWRRAADRVSREVRLAGLAWLPAAGMLVGACALLATMAGRQVHPALGAAFGATALQAVGGRAASPAMAVAALVQLASLLLLPAALAPLALLLAPALARWAMVVQCYGGVPAAGETASPVGRARFREFGWASLLAIGAALVASEALGLVLVLAAAATTVALRVRAYRRGRGLSRADLARAGLAVETIVLAMLAAVTTGLASWRAPA
jgi:hypothetical protein